MEVGHSKVITAIAVDYLFGEKREKRRKIKRVMRRRVLTRSTKRMRDQVIVRHQQINIEPDVERLMVCNCRYTPGKGGRAAAE